MAIFSKKPESLFSDPNIKGETLAYFKQKTEILKNTKIKSGAEKAKKDAQIIENFLNAIKNREYKKGDLKSIIDENSFNQLIENLPQNLFKRVHTKEELEEDFDDIFEKELSDILHKMMKDSRKGKFLSGIELGSTISKNEDIERLLDYSKIYLLDSVGENIVEKMQKLGKGTTDIFKIPSIKEQKTDVSVNIKLETEVKEEYKKVMSLFNEYNFSLKNYASSNIISLGNTNPFKSIVGSLTSLGATQPVAIKAFYAATSVYTRENNSSMGQELAEYIYIMRYYYELTGAGILINNEPISKVDFLIVNNPNGKIRVISTKEIMLDILNQENIINTSKDPFSAIHYTVKF